MIIKNYDDLISHGQTQVRTDALKIVQAGIMGGDPEAGTRRQVKRVGDTLHIAKRAGNGKLVIVIVPDTGERYISTDLFGS